jgi:hypothetical protein
MSKKCNASSVEYLASWITHSWHFYYNSWGEKNKQYSVLSSTQSHFQKKAWFGLGSVEYLVWITHSRVDQEMHLVCPCAFFFFERMCVCRSETGETLSVVKSSSLSKKRFRTEIRPSPYEIEGLFARRN